MISLGELGVFALIGFAVLIFGRKLLKKGLMDAKGVKDDIDEVFKKKPEENVKAKLVKE